MPRAEATVRPKDFHAEIVSTETRLLITTGTDLIVAGIALETPAVGVGGRTELIGIQHR